MYLIQNSKEERTGIPFCLPSKNEVDIVDWNGRTMNLDEGIDKKRNTDSFPKNCCENTSGNVNEAIVFP